MMIRNILRKFTREDCIFLACFIAMFGGILLYNANKQADGFITVAHDRPERFVNGKNILIKRVHEEHWDIRYGFDEDCPASFKTEENYRVLREHLEKGIRIWLAPLREITDRPIVDKFVFDYGEKHEDAHYEISVIFLCEDGRSMAGRSSRTINMRTIKIGTVEAFFSPSLPYAISRLLHELGHVFDLADTYVGNPSFSPPSTGDSSSTIGRQPQSIMSIGVGCGGDDRWVLCLDDKRAIQWLYRYHWEGLDPTNCPPEFEYEELTHEGKTVGGCVFKQPLIVELRQGHLNEAKWIIDSDKNLKINDQDEHGLTALHYVAPLHLDFDRATFRSFVIKSLDYPGINVNITDKHGNTPLHLSARFGNALVVFDLLFTAGASAIFEKKGIRLNSQNNYGMTPLHYAAKLGREECVQYLLFRTDIDLNIKDNRGNTPLHEASKNGHTEVVKKLLEHQDIKNLLEHEDSKKLLAHEDINPNLRNAAGFTPLQLALQGGAVSAADSDESFQADYPELWALFSEEDRQHLSARLSPAALQQAHAEIAALLRAYPGIILPDASDVNGDGVVNILDLVRVANAFGQRGQIPEDVNGDGVVNVQDLVWVSGAFGQ